MPFKVAAHEIPAIAARARLELAELLSRPDDDMALFRHLSGPVYRVPVRELKRLRLSAKAAGLAFYDALTRSTLSAVGEEFELDSEAWPRVEKCLLDLARYRDMDQALGREHALRAYLDEAGLSGGAP